LLSFGLISSGEEQPRPLRLTQDTSQGAESQAIANIKEAVLSLPFSWTCQLISPEELRYICNGDIIEQLLFGSPLPETTNGQDILDVVESYFGSHDLSWKSCVSIRTDGAPSMSESLKEIRCIGQGKEPWNCFYAVFPAQSGSHFKISSS
jgi:hypothetical protein